LASEENVEPHLGKRRRLDDAARRRQSSGVDERLRDVERAVFRDRAAIFLILDLRRRRGDVRLFDCRPALHRADHARRVQAAPLRENAQILDGHALDARDGHARLLFSADHELAAQKMPRELVPQTGAVRLVSFDEELLRVRDLLGARDLELLLAEPVHARARELAQARFQTAHDALLALLANDLRGEHRDRARRFLHGAPRGEERGVRLCASACTGGCRAPT
jgi:hypothetical protein